MFTKIKLILLGYYLYASYLLRFRNYLYITWANDRPQFVSMHTNGRSPVCKRRWLFKLVTWVNALPHSLHMYGLSFRWILSWFRKFAACVNPLISEILKCKKNKVFSILITQLTLMTICANKFPINGMISHMGKQRRFTRKCFRTQATSGFFTK